MSRVFFKPSLRRLTAAAATLATLLASAGVSQAQTTIPLSGTAGAICTIAVTPDTSAGHSTSLPITVPGPPPQTVVVGTVLQSCNLVAGYTLSVTSSNCLSVPVGAKLIESVSSSNLPFSVNSVSPATGTATPSVTGLLGSACLAQLARDVTGAAVSGENSTISVVFTGSATLFPGTYQDTLTFTMTTK
ncbi:MAG: hypothetical protein ACYCZX_03815 [Rhodospirillaceae bacterium]